MIRGVAHKYANPGSILPLIVRLKGLKIRLENVYVGPEWVKMVQVHLNFGTRET
jgi:hypothetical protein